jgi:hypothetical protein
MSHRIARLVILATAIALAACTSPTSPTRSDCGGGSTIGQDGHC